MMQGEGPEAFACPVLTGTPIPLSGNFTIFNSHPLLCDFSDVREAHSRFCLPAEKHIHLNSFLSEVTQDAGQKGIPTCCPQCRQPGPSGPQARPGYLP